MKTKKIKRWAFDEEVALVEIAKEVNASKSLVSLVIRGQRVNGPKAKEVIEAIKQRGCPAAFFEDDQDAA